MRAWVLFAALSVALVSAASAQDRPDAPATVPKPPEAPATTEAPTSGSPLGITPETSVEEVMERLRRLLGSYSPLGPAGEAVVNQSPTVRRGDVIVAVPVSPRRVGRLGNDLVQSATMFSRERVVMPAGTPVYYTRVSYSVTNYGVVIQSTDYDAWCGVVTEGRRARQVGYCALQTGSLRHLSSAVGGSPYWPRTLNPPVGANNFEIIEDQTALAEFPPLELVYTFVEFDENDADVRRGVRVGGGEVIEVNNVSLQRQGDGSSLLRVAGGVLRLHRTEQRRTARIAVDTAPTSYDPAEEEVALRALAEALVQRARNQQPTPPAPPAPAQ